MSLFFYWTLFVMSSLALCLIHSFVPFCFIGSLVHRFLPFYLFLSIFPRSVLFCSLIQFVHFVLSFIRSLIWLCFANENIFSPFFLCRCPVCRAPIPGWDGKGGGVVGLVVQVVVTA
ncbi:hypothetical protein DFH05DRAFT_1479583 [Lentinula detonsa]|uniref:Uncharacterized protein n=1 Tax=Lentinula detonsa TaxID=2804962 RepID=A0A9W8U0C3_9AGAR|nr:hypothetical protein DFH05DRAFT_1479583 [Lentinula detonsa]